MIFGQTCKNTDFGQLLSSISIDQKRCETFRFENVIINTMTKTIKFPSHWVKNVAAKICHQKHKLAKYHKGSFTYNVITKGEGGGFGMTTLM